jgi:hypothetical protein
MFAAGRSKIICPSYLLGVRKGLFKLSHFSEGLLLIAFLIRVICPTSGKCVALVTRLVGKARATLAILAKSGRKKYLRVVLSPGLRNMQLIAGVTL